MEIGTIINSKSMQGLLPDEDKEESFKTHDKFVPAPTFDPAPVAVSCSETTLQPIHRSIGVSRSASTWERSKAGAEKASFTPSNKPFKAVVDGEFWLWGRTAKPETVEAVKRSVVAVFIVFLI